MTHLPLRLAAAVVAAGTAAQAPPGVLFTDVTERAGIRFRHENGADGKYWYPELFGGGVAVLDADGDEWPDLLFVNGRPWSAAPSRPTTHRLYRNNHDGTFADITAGSGFDAAAVYGLGATVADYDNDGRDDVFVTTVEGGRLFHSEGRGRFRDVTAASGIGNRDFAVSAAWLDYDRDGLADLFVGNYVRWSPDAEVVCADRGVRGYCGPDAYGPRAPKLYRNAGGGRFEDVSVRAGFADASDKAMGVAVLDYDADGWPDLFVGSDRVPARLYRNEGGRRFVDHGVQAGVALSENGRARANMGADAADYDRSGHPDIVVGNFTNEMLGLYRSENGRSFADVAPRSEVGRSSLLYVTWAVFFLDADLDGWLDIFAANGGTDESQGRDARARLSQPALLLRNRGDATFENITPRAGPALNRPLMARGAAYADFDGDGDLDIAVATLDGPAYVLRNDTAPQHGWLRVRADGSPTGGTLRSTRSGLGTTIRVRTASGAQAQTVRSGSSYASQSELTLTFGLGAEKTIEAVEVLWPSGRVHRFADVRGNQSIVVEEARGTYRAVR